MIPWRHCRSNSPGRSCWRGCASFGVASCTRGCQPSGRPTRTGASVTNRSTEYYFAMEQDCQQTLLQGVSELKIGDLRPDVIKRLGPPSDDRKLLSKERGEFRGRLVTYSIKIWKRDLVNEKYDRFVKLQFDTDDRLVNIIRKVDDSP